MKRVLALILALCMAFSLFACGKSRRRWPPAEIVPR